MDETQDPKPHVVLSGTPHRPDDTLPGDATSRKPALSIWFLCGMLTLIYGLCLVSEGLLEWHHPPATVLADLRPTFYWGLALTAFGLFYTLRFRSGKSPR